VTEASNPDEIALDDGDDDDEPAAAAAPMEGVEEAALTTTTEGAGTGATKRSTKFLALSKPGKNKEFLQVCVLCARDGSSPRRQLTSYSLEQVLTIQDPKGSTGEEQPTTQVTVPAASTDAAESEPSPPLPQSRRRPKLFFDPHWLAIVRATAPFLSLEQRQKPFPPLAELTAQIEKDYEWVRENVGTEGDGLVEVDEVMKFLRTAPTQEEWERNGMIQMRECAALSRGLIDSATVSSLASIALPSKHTLSLTPNLPPASWYTNPQTLAFTSLLQIENRINPIPEGYLEALEAEKRRELERVKAEALRQVEMAGERVIDEEPVGEKVVDLVREGAGGGEELPAGLTAAAAPAMVANPEEIAIDDDED
jgi:lariat debranching enzyme